MNKLKQHPVLSGLALVALLGLLGGFALIVFNLQSVYSLMDQNLPQAEANARLDQAEKLAPVGVWLMYAGLSSAILFLGGLVVRYIRSKSKH